MLSRSNVVTIDLVSINIRTIYFAYVRAFFRKATRAINTAGHVQEVAQVARGRPLVWQAIANVRSSRQTWRFEMSGRFDRSGRFDMSGRLDRFRSIAKVGRLRFGLLMFGRLTLG